MLVVIMEHSASSVYAGGKKSLWVRFVQIQGTCHKPARNMAFSAVCYREGNRPESVHGQMAVGCRDSNVRG